MKDYLNKLIESNDTHPYYDYVLEYNAYYVFDAVINNENLWTPLINPSMYHKALSELIKYGDLISFPQKYIYQWMGIVMKKIL